MRRKLNRTTIALSLAWTSFGILAIGCLSGCQNDQDRIDKTIKELESHSPGAYASVISKLRKSTSESLQKPSIVYARLVEQKKTVLLSVDWIESKPSVDAMGIRCGNGDSWEFYPLYEDDAQENIEDSERDFVLFDAGVSWAPEDDSWLAVADDVRAGRCSVALFHDGQIVSNIEPIKYIRGPTLTDGQD